MQVNPSALSGVGSWVRLFVCLFVCLFWGVNNCSDIRGYNYSLIPPHVFGGYDLGYHRRFPFYRRRGLHPFTQTMVTDECVASIGAQVLELLALREP
jgi:hypothetical protein